MLFTTLLIAWPKKVSIVVIQSKLFNKEIVITEKENGNFENFTKCCICDSYYIDVDVKLGGHCHVTGKYRGSAHRDCNINVKINHEILAELYNLKKFDSHLIMQLLDKYDLKINMK